MPAYETRPIPSEFLCLDVRTNQADSFANAHDLQKLRENHNILIARGIKRVLLCTVVADKNGVGAAVRTSGWGSAGPGLGTLLWSSYIAIGPHVQEITVVIRAAEVTAAIADPVIYPVVTLMPQAAQIDTSVSMTITGAAIARYTCDVTVPPSLRLHGGFARVSLYMHAAEAAANAKNPTAITDVGPDWVQGEFGADFTGYVIYFDDATVQPRLITRMLTDITGTEDRAYVNAPWNKEPIPGTDQFAIRETARVDLQTVSLYEKAVSDFDTGTEITDDLY